MADSAAVIDVQFNQTILKKLRTSVEDLFNKLTTFSAILHGVVEPADFTDIFLKKVSRDGKRLSRDLQALALSSPNEAVLGGTRGFRRSISLGSNMNYLVAGDVSHQGIDGKPMFKKNIAKIS